MAKHTFTIVSSFESEDDFGTDAYGFYVELDGKTIVEYGDDSGQAKSEGFVEGYIKAKGWTPDERTIKHEQRADYEW